MTEVLVHFLPRTKDNPFDAYPETAMPTKKVDVLYQVLRNNPLRLSACFQYHNPSPKTKRAISLDGQVRLNVSHACLVQHYFVSTIRKFPAILPFRKRPRPGHVTRHGSG